MERAILAAWVAVCAVACGRPESRTSNEGRGAPDTLSATGVDTGSAGPADAIDGESFSYGCDREYRFVARIGPGGESVRLLLPDTTLTLPHVVSASGARYSDGVFTYWSKGDEASLETPAGSFSSCVSDEGGAGWVEARARGVRFRAVGQEPFWNLEIEADGAITIEALVNETRYRFPPADPEAEDEHGRTVYRLETEAYSATIVIEDEPCRDSMSGWPYEATVSITLDDRELNGCGRWL